MSIVLRPVQHHKGLGSVMRSIVMNKEKQELAIRKMMGLIYQDTTGATVYKQHAPVTIEELLRLANEKIKLAHDIKFIYYLKKDCRVEIEIFEVRGAVTQHYLSAVYEQPRPALIEAILRATKKWEES